MRIDKLAVGVGSTLGVLGAALAGGAVYFSFTFYVTGALHPDPSTGRVFPVQMHGILYVTRETALCFYGCVASGFASLVSGLTIGYLGERSRRADRE